MDCHKQLRCFFHFVVMFLRTSKGSSKYCKRGAILFMYQTPGRKDCYVLVAMDVVLIVGRKKTTLRLVLFLIEIEVITDSDDAFLY